MGEAKRRAAATDAVPFTEADLVALIEAVPCAAYKMPLGGKPTILVADYRFHPGCWPAVLAASRMFQEYVAGNAVLARQAMAKLSPGVAP